MFSGLRGKKGGEVACIFVHAGAGYHSVQNEHVHLAACNDASKAAMAVMKAGGTAIDAVEIAIKVLEDREITNAGYGSNLAVDGVVECDAVIVNHIGRSGGAGAVSQIKNPISLARLLLDGTQQQLSLRRVPPNLLVGQGATDYAYEHGMPVLPIDYLISPSARERWRRWRNDLDKAENTKRREESAQHGLPPRYSETDMTVHLHSRHDFEGHRRSHTKAMMSSVWNDAQPISPPPSDYREDSDDFQTSVSTKSAYSTPYSESSNTSHEAEDGSFIDPEGPPGMMEDVVKSSPPSTLHKAAQPALVANLARQSSGDSGLPLHRNCASEVRMGHAVSSRRNPLSTSYGWQDGSSGSDSDNTAIVMNTQTRPRYSGQRTATPAPNAIRHHPSEPSEPQELKANHRHSLPTRPLPFNDGALQQEDLITDTVGAIAVDMYGNIACGASSGGIGMKHRGRIGPAALVGIGAHVVPVAEGDREGVTVATVTSGTGEHMATTTAAKTCSLGVYNGKRTIAGGKEEECGDDESIHSFIEKDFMGHPSVKQSNSTGAIGMLTLKKTSQGIYCYFGHNTDSFALASMHSDDTKPVCTISRSKGNGVIAQGGRAIRYRRKR